MKAAKPMLGYKVRIHQHCDYSEREPEEFGSWNESYTNEFYSIDKVSETSYADVYSQVNLDKQEGFLVWAEYSTGDSFGSSSRGSVEVLALISTEDQAKEFKKKLQDWTDSKRSGADSGTDWDWNFKTIVDGQEFKMHIPWIGYFEHLDEIHIESIPKK